MTNTIGRPGTSYTQHDNGVPSDRALNHAFDKAAKDGTKVDGVEVVKVLQRAVDGGAVTDKERNSINMALDAKMLTPAAETIARTFLASDSAKDGWETRRTNDAMKKAALQVGQEQSALQAGTASMLQTRIEQKG